MDIFISLLAKLIPLYGIILVGYILGKYFRVDKEFVARGVVYGIAPVIFFNAAAVTPITLGIISLPILTFTINCCICLLFTHIGSLYWRDATKNVLGYIAPGANTGYFGLPVAIFLFDKPIVELYIVAILGILIYENTLGFFIAARGVHGKKESIIKLLKLPVIYAVALGFVVNITGVSFGPIYDTAISYAKSLYVVFGMMIIGLGLAGMKKFELDYLFVGFTFLAKFIVWPFVALIIILVDWNFLHFYTTDIHHILLLISVMPLAANTVAISTILRIHPEKVAITVVLSTLFSLLYVPLMVMLFLH